MVVVDVMKLVVTLQFIPTLFNTQIWTLAVTVLSVQICLQTSDSLRACVRACVRCESASVSCHVFSFYGTKSNKLSLETGILTSFSCGGRKENNRSESKDGRNCRKGCFCAHRGSLRVYISPPPPDRFQLSRTTRETLTKFVCERTTGRN